MICTYMSEKDKVIRPKIGQDRIERLQMWMSRGGRTRVLCTLGRPDRWNEISVDEALDELLKEVGF